MPKWTSGFRPGKTTMDIYKLFSKEELEILDADAIRERTEQALLFDAYREQERILAKYKNGSNLKGLENVLYCVPIAEPSSPSRSRISTLCTAKTAVTANPVMNTAFYIKSVMWDRRFGTFPIGAD